jgi:hypothetical protein
VVPRGRAATGALPWWRTETLRLGALPRAGALLPVH